MSEEPSASMPQLVMRVMLPPELPTSMLPRGFVLRRADEGDEPALASLLSRAFDARWMPETVARNLTGNPGVDSVFCVDSGSSLLATASARIGDGPFAGLGYVHWVGVDPSARRLGLGRAVSVAVLQRFVELGYQSAVLETDDFRLEAIRMYLGLGFKPEFTHHTHKARWKIIDADLARRIGDTA